MTPTLFDTPIDRTNTHSMKWDEMQSRYGVSAKDGLPMWVADMDFQPPQCVLDALQKTVDHGVFGYYGQHSSYREAIAWWMKTRHDWTLDPNHICTTQGLVNAVGLCLDAFTSAGDGVVLFTPVYHAFARTITAAGRKVVECPLAVDPMRPTFDWESYEAQMTGSEAMLILCSPHNPGGQVWSRAELEAVADFAKRHDLILVSDEIHHDLTFAGYKHIPMPHIEGIADRLVMLTAPSKTFNIAASYTGQVTIANDALRTKFKARQAALGLSPNSFGLFMTEAAYSPAGAQWLDELMVYIEDNRKIFDAGIAKIPGLRALPLEATYLSWVDFSGTGMSVEQYTARVQEDAKIVANHGETFGAGGETFLRFNLGTQRANIIEAIERLTRAFGDLQ